MMVGGGIVSAVGNFLTAAGTSITVGAAFCSRSLLCGVVLDCFNVAGRGGAWQGVCLV
jgi:hypothetical protein